MRSNRVRSVVSWALAADAALVLAACSAMTVPGGNAERTTHTGPGGPVASAAPRTVIQPQPPAGSCRSRGSGLFSLPDPRCTPGAVNPAVSQQNIGMTICREGFTARERPPESVSEPEKRASLAGYGDAGPLRAYEYDHLVPLELGGAVNDPRNLWPEPGASLNPKDALERALNSLVCRERLALAAAQRLIASGWVAAYRRYADAVPPR